MGRYLDWLLEPSHRWFRVPAAVALLIGGVFAPIPFIGVCMVPAGLVLLGEDLPRLKRPLETGAQWFERAWASLSRRFR